MMRVERINMVNPWESAPAQVRGLLVFDNEARGPTTRRIFVSRKPPAWPDDAPALDREFLKEIEL